WAKCRDVEIAPTFHSAGSNQALRNSPTNFTYNHIGHFADAGHAAAKGIFLGGVTRRFPELRFAFLEGGVGWGAQLFGDLMEHWERRNIKALDNMRPDKLDRKLLNELVEDGVLTEGNFRDFVFANAVRLWGTQNPRFFEGTRVAKEATAVLQAQQQPAFQDAAK